MSKGAVWRFVCSIVLLVILLVQNFFVFHLSLRLLLYNAIACITSDSVVQKLLLTFFSGAAVSSRAWTPDSGQWSTNTQ